MSRLGFVRLVTAFALASWLLAPAAYGASFTSVTTALGAGNSTNLLVDTATTTRVRNSTVGVVSSNATSFSTQYAMLVGTDIGNTASITENFTASYTITLSVMANPGENWQILLNTTRVGALTIINDGNGGASATLGAVTGSVAGGALTGTLNLAAVGTTTNDTNNATRATSPNTPFDSSAPFNQLSNATVSGVGTGAVQVVTLGFTWTASASSIRHGNAGDEAAVRMGRTSTATFYSADDYPGAGARNQSLDGHFVSATIIPEPATAFLLTIGLLGLAWSSRRRE